MKKRKRFITLLLFVLLASWVVFMPKLGLAQEFGGGEGISADTINTFDPLNFLGASSEKVNTFSTPGGIISEALKYLFPIAGLILFIMIVWGGFEMLIGAADTKSQEAGKNRIQAAAIGFGLLFVSYWLAKILEWVFGVNILG